MLFQLVLGGVARLVIIPVEAVSAAAAAGVQVDAWKQECRHIASGDLVRILSRSDRCSGVGWRGREEGVQEVGEVVAIYPIVSRGNNGASGRGRAAKYREAIEVRSEWRKTFSPRAIFARE